MFRYSTHSYSLLSKQRSQLRKNQLTPSKQLGISRFFSFIHTIIIIIPVQSSFFDLISLIFKRTEKLTAKWHNWAKYNTLICVASYCYQTNGDAASFTSSFENWRWQLYLDSRSQLEIKHMSQQSNRSNP